MANKSSNPHLLAFCKSPATWSEWSIVWSPFSPLESSVLSFCACHSEHGSKGDRLEATNPSTWPFHPLTHTLPLIGRLITRPHPLALAAYLLSWPTFVWCSVGVRRVLVVGYSPTHTQTCMVVSHLSAVLLSESVGGWWFVPAAVVIAIQASGSAHTLRDEGSISYLLLSDNTLFLSQSLQKSSRRSMSVFFQTPAMISI